MIWDDEFETLPREALAALQSKRLRALIERVYSAVPFYRRKFDEAGYRAGDVRGLEDLPDLPFTTKDDLRETYPFGLFAVPMERVVRVHASSGTTGKPTVVGYTRRDIDTGAELMGATVIPISGGNTKRQIMLMQDFGSTILLCTPSYALNLAEVMAEEGVDPASLRLKCGLFGAEPWTESMRGEIEKKLKISALDIYGLSEVIGPGVASECIEEKRGLHVFEDHYQLIVSREGSLDVLEVQVEVGEAIFTDEIKGLETLSKRIEHEIKDLLGVSCKVKLVEPKTIQRSEGKAKRVIDQRKL